MIIPGAVFEKMTSFAIFGMLEIIQYLVELLKGNSFTRSTGEFRHVVGIAFVCPWRESCHGGSLMEKLPASITHSHTLNHICSQYLPPPSPNSLSRRTFNLYFYWVVRGAGFIENMRISLNNLIYAFVGLTIDQKRQKNFCLSSPKWKYIYRVRESSLLYLQQAE